MPEHSLERHPILQVISPAEYAQLRRDVQLCRVSWPISFVLASPPGRLVRAPVSLESDDRVGP